MAASPIVGAARAGAAEGLRRAAEQLVERVLVALPKGDPAVDPDPAVALADAIRIEEDGEGLVIVVAAPYAAKQHEDQRLEHPRGGHAKYLEGPLKELVPQLEGIVGSSVAAHMRRDVSSHAATPGSRLQRVG